MATLDNWAQVGELLPGRDQRVIVYDKVTKIQGVGWITGEGDSRMWVVLDAGIVNPSHWRDFPERPTEEPKERSGPFSRGSRFSAYHGCNVPTVELEGSEHYLFGLDSLDQAGMIADWINERFAESLPVLESAILWQDIDIAPPPYNIRLHIADQSGNVTKGEYSSLDRVWDTDHLVGAISRWAYIHDDTPGVEWVSWKERRPMLAIPVFVADDRSRETSIAIRVRSEDPGIGWYWDWPIGSPLERVTHWANIPLPKWGEWEIEF
jgi:hypothetical protein